LVAAISASPVANHEAAHANATGHEADAHEDVHHGVNLASWRWPIYGDIIMFCLTILLAALFKLIFHHAHFLSKRVPESVSVKLSQK
jgi:hypothetical protein